MKGNKVPETASAQLTARGKRAEASRRRKIDAELREEKIPSMGAHDPRNKPVGSWEDLSGAMGVTPTDVLGRVAGHTKNYGLAAFAGALKATETFGTAKTARPVSNVAWFSPPGESLGVRGAIAGYLARKTGRSVGDLIKKNPDMKNKVLQLIRNTDLGEIHEVLESGYTESPSIAITRHDASQHAIPSTAFREKSNGPTVYVHYKRKGFDFDVRPGHIDVAVPRDAMSPTTKTVINELNSGKTYSDILRGWVERTKQLTGGRKANMILNNIVFDDAGPRTMTEQEFLSFSGRKTLDGYGLEPSVASGNQLKGMEWDSLRAQRGGTTRWGELKPLRHVPNSAIDFVEIPRYRTDGRGTVEIIPRNDRFGLQRALESAGIKYRVYDERDQYRARWQDPLVFKYPYHPSMLEYNDLAARERLPAGAVHPKIKVERFQQDSKGGDAGEGSEVALPKEPAPATSGARIVINPSVFRDNKDALCVAWNERLRIWMEENGYEPQQPPTEEQREFFADTPYAQDELQMRRTILARIATFDTSIERPTAGQVAETLDMLHGFAKTEQPSNRYEADSLARITAAVKSLAENDGDLDDLTGEPDEETPAAYDEDLDSELEPEYNDDLDGLVEETGRVTDEDDLEQIIGD